MVINEEDLVARLKSRDKAALEYLYDHYSAALNGVVSRVIKHEEVAAEVLQDVFLKIWERISYYDPSKGRLFTWMFNLARNQAIDKLRSREISRERKTGSLEGYVSTVDKGSQVEQKIESIGLSGVLDQLQDEQRFVVEYLYLRGFTQSELAQEFNIPLGTVKTRLRLAMVVLRKIFNVK